MEFWFDILEKRDRLSFLLSWQADCHFYEEDCPSSVVAEIEQISAWLAKNDWLKR